MRDKKRQDKEEDKKKNGSVGKQNKGHVSTYLVQYFPFRLHLLSDFSVVNFSSSAAGGEKVEKKKKEKTKSERRGGKEKKREIFQLAAVWTGGSSSMTKKYIHC